MIELEWNLKPSSGVLLPSGIPLPNGIPLLRSGVGKMKGNLVFRIRLILNILPADLATAN
jgi:hypothetical protein